MTQDELFQITKAATNLNGVITLLDLRKVVEQYFPSEKMTVTKLEETLLGNIPSDMGLVLRDGLVFLELFLYDEEKLKDILKKQQGKTCYLPHKKEQFLLYASEEYYRPTLEWKTMEQFFLEVRHEKEALGDLMSKIRFEQQFSFPMETTFRSVLEYDFLPMEKEKQDEMIDLLIAMDATARKCEHKGKSLWEMERI